jgi:hypothetical protein
MRKGIKKKKKKQKNVPWHLKNKNINMCCMCLKYLYRALNLEKNKYNQVDH